jgi:hypothetical protein
VEVLYEAMSWSTAVACWLALATEIAVEFVDALERSSRPNSSCVYVLLLCVYIPPSQGDSSMSNIVILGDAGKRG